MRWEAASSPSSASVTGVKRETTFCMGLRRSLNRSGRGVCDLAGDVQRAPVDVDVFPLQRTQLTAPGASDRGETKEDRQAPVDRARRFDEADDLLGAGQV